MIPAMTDPMGRHWQQPGRDVIEIDETHALMTRASFDKLGEYSCSQPTGCYLGKMWKRHDGLYDKRCPPADRRWLLCWFDESTKGPDYCSTQFREILLVDGDLTDVQ